jgi:hypothetical protein
MVDALEGELEDPLDSFIRRVPHQEQFVERAKDIAQITLQERHQE